jgi:hypothetical protein
MRAERASIIPKKIERILTRNLRETYFFVRMLCVTHRIVDKKRVDFCNNRQIGRILKISGNFRKFSADKNALLAGFLKSKKEGASRIS